MPDLSEKTGLVYCPICGKCYDSRKDPVCPNCRGGKSSFPATARPGGANGQEKGLGPTAPPSSAFGGGMSERMGGGTRFVGCETPDGAVVGWLVAVSGPCKGKDYRIHLNYNYIGREEGDILITGDMNISGRRDSVLLFEDGENRFYISHVEGKNVLRVNGVPALSTVELHNYDRISIGATDLVFVGLCGDEFSWRQNND